MENEREVEIEEEKNMLVNVMTLDGTTIPLHMTEAESILIETDQDLLRRIIQREHGDAVTVVEEKAEEPEEAEEHTETPATELLNKIAEGKLEDSESLVEEQKPADLAPVSVGDDACDAAEHSQDDQTRDLAMDAELEQGKSSPVSVTKVWSTPRVKKLIALCKEFAKRLAQPKKREAWKEIATRLNEECQSHFSLLDIEKKWHNLRTRHRMIMAIIEREGSVRGKLWPFFYEVDAALKAVPSGERHFKPYQPRIQPNPTDEQGSMSPPSSPESTHDEDYQAAPHEWFVSLFHDHEERFLQRHEEHLKELKKQRKVEKKRNKLLKKMLDKFDTSRH